MGTRDSDILSGMKLILEEMRDIRTDMKGLQSETKEIRGEMIEIRGEMREIREEMREVRGEIRDALKRGDERLDQYARDSETREKGISQALVLIGRVGRDVLKKQDEHTSLLQGIQKILADRNGKNGNGHSKK